MQALRLRRIGDGARGVLGGTCREARLHLRLGKTTEVLWGPGESANARGHDHRHLRRDEDLGRGEPGVAEEERAKIQNLPAGLSRVILHYGFMESPSVPHGLRLPHEQAQLNCGNLSKISYYLGRETIIPTERIPGMWVWRERLYVFMQHNAERSAAYFSIPAAQVVEMGIEIEI